MPKSNAQLERELGYAQDEIDKLKGELKDALSGVEELEGELEDAEKMTLGLRKYLMKRDRLANEIISRIESERGELYDLITDWLADTTLGNVVEEG